jgi:hypothetical protein
MRRSTALGASAVASLLSPMSETMAMFYTPSKGQLYGLVHIKEPEPPAVF